MLTIIIIILLLIGILFYFKLVLANDDKDYFKHNEHIFNAHKAIGYPALTKEQQFDILDNENTAPLRSLTPYPFIPTGLLNHYITVEPEEYLEHLRQQNLLERLKFDPEDLRDGFFIHYTSKGYKFLFVERGSISFKKVFKSYDKLLRYLVYDRLMIHAPNAYKGKINSRYYA